MKNSSDTIGNRTRDLPALIAKHFLCVSQVTAIIVLNFEEEFKITSNPMYSTHANSDVTANRCSVFCTVVKLFCH
jgi:hypothetical protein